jgi:hypothetical protein
MKVYNLRCAYAHRFEGWFSSEQDFQEQSAQKLIECPLCGDHEIEKLPSAPRLNLSNPLAAKQDSAARPDAAAQLNAHWLALARQIVANTEDVGERFAEEARRIHYREAPERGIRGMATPEEREALSEEGIETAQFPLPAALKHSLQ